MTLYLTIDYWGDLSFLTYVIEGVLCRGYSASVPARLESDIIVAICVEAEGHNNWLQTYACCVWESQASPRKDIPASFGSSHIPPLFACDWF